jgi:hypothetical protein
VAVQAVVLVGTTIRVEQEQAAKATQEVTMNHLQDGMETAEAEALAL